MGRTQPDPTPQEIREACEKIRATWSEAEERKRRTDVPIGWQGWTVPLMRVSAVDFGICEPD